MRRRFTAAALLLVLAQTLAGCGGPAPSRGDTQPGRLDAGPPRLPPMRSFEAARVTPPQRPNAAMVRDFLDLGFQMESGRNLPVLTRYEGPITVAVTGDMPRTADADLDRLIRRFRSEAGLDIRRGTNAATASIVVEFLPRRTMQKLVPQAACFVAPRVGSWREYRAARRSDKVDWTTLTTRTRATVFIPNDTAPQEVRDCLHEEIAQAMGPLNDLYRLPDSVFNDDNFHTVLTGFDMLMLRATYAADLRSGMTRDQVAAVLPGLLDRLNPAGAHRGAGPAIAPAPRAWKDAIETALGPGASNQGRRDAARRAVQIAEAGQWTDPRRAFSYFALGRLSLATEAETALGAFLTAGALYSAAPGTEVQAAHVDMQLAAFALTAGQTGDAITLANRSLVQVARCENAALLATLLMIKAEALDLEGRSAEASVVRGDSLGWARYGFGSDAQVRARLSEIAALAPLDIASMQAAPVGQRQGVVR